MRIVILTSSITGTAAHHLQYLIKEPSIVIAAVILSKGHRKKNSKYYLRRLKKIWSIGLLGALNGIRMRKWFTLDVAKKLGIESIETMCSRNNLPFFTVPSHNSEKTHKILQTTSADIGLSLGNGYISKKVFTIPKYGMINIHHEVLPDYKNAQSIIWQLYNNSMQTGYTIHQIDECIDTGSILFQEKISITIGKSLRETIILTSCELLHHSAIGLVNVLSDFEGRLLMAKPQVGGNTYTTPSIRQYFRMERNFREFKNLSEKF
jgi:methionyl-tRNA formyltransferase